MKLWIDDERNPPDNSWIIARTADNAMRLIGTGIFQEISLDHDLGEEKTGYDVICHLEFLLNVKSLMFSFPDVIRCHSANPVGRARIEQAISAIMAKRA